MVPSSYLTTTLLTFQTPDSLRLHLSLLYVISRTNESDKRFQYASQLSIARVMFDFVNITCTVRLDPVNTTGAETDCLLVQTSGKQKKLLA